MVKKFLSVLLSMMIVLSCMGTVSFASDTEIFSVESLEQYCVYAGEIANDGYIGIPVGIKTYVKDASAATSDTPYIMYIVNTNTVRYGTDSDEVILTDMLDKGYVVTVIDYYNNEKAKTPDLEWSIQKIKTKLRTDANYRSTYLAGVACSNTYVYSLPAGYNLTRQVNFWSIDRHGVAGSLDFIVSVWNSDFLGVWGDKGIITYADGTKQTVREYTESLPEGKVTDIYQCIKRDGNIIDFNLYMDIIYPTHPEKEVPVLMYTQSSQSTVGTWNTEERPHLTGFLFNGYAGVLHDFAYVPMSRNDNWGYYDGDGAGSVGGVTGDNYTYSLGKPNDMKSNAAAIRYIRHLADTQRDTYNFDLDKFGLIGISKTGNALRMGNPDPTKIGQQRHLEGHYGETRYEIGDTEGDGMGENGTDLVRGGEPQPWLTYEDGSEIPSNVQFVYTSVGSGEYAITDGFAPIYSCGTMATGGSYYGFWPSIMSRAYTHDIPALGYVCPDVGHSFGIGPDRDYGNDTIVALYEMANYWLKDEAARCEYIDPVNGSVRVGATDKITVKFNGPISEEEIKKVTIISNNSGEAAKGEWAASYGKTTWEFVPYNLRGGHTYTVNVPDSIKAENGKNIKAAKSASFTVETELAVSAIEVTADNSMTLSKTESADNGVYFAFDSADFSNSTTTAIRFGVKNDAANIVDLYSAESGEAKELIGSVNINGAGEYDIDVTDYVNSLSSAKAEFILKANKNTEDKIVYQADFENGSIPSSMSGKLPKEISADVDNTTGLGSSLKFTAQNLTTSFMPWHAFYAGDATLLTITAANAFKDADYGRKFTFSASIYDTAERQINLSVGAHNLNEEINLKAVKNSYRTQTDKWTDYSFDFRVDKVGSGWQENKIGLQAEMFGAKSSELPLYLDDVTLTEHITDVELTSAADGVYCAPSLVLHPANKVSTSELASSYVQSGTEADVSYEAEADLLVSGRNGGMFTTDRKTYAKIDLASCEAGKPVMLTLKSLSTGSGTISVYGVADKDLSDSWSANSINYINAPANDRFGRGVDASAVYGKAPVAAVSVNGAGYHMIDVTDYVEAMKESGAESATVIFVSETDDVSLNFELVGEETDKNLYYKVMDFDDRTDWKSGSGLAEVNDIADMRATSIEKGSVVIAEGIDRTSMGGNSLAFNMVNTYTRNKFYNIYDHVLTADDVGRKFKISFWAMAESDASFALGLMSAEGASAEAQAAGYPKYNSSFYTESNPRKDVSIKANEWTKAEYTITVTEKMLSSYCVGYENSSYHPALFTIVSNGLANKTLYVDDLVIEEVVESENGVYSREFTFDDWSSIRQGTSYEVNDSYDMRYYGLDGSDGDKSTGSLDAATDRTAASGKSLKFMTNATAGSTIWKFYNIFDHNLTSADIGRSFKVSIWLKPDADTTAQLGLTSVNNGKTYGFTRYNNTFYKGTSGNITANEWQKLEYEFTVDEVMLASYYTGYSDSFLNPALIGLRFGKGSTVWVDDLSVVETTGSVSTDNSGEESISVYSNALSFDDWTNADNIGVYGAGGDTSEDKSKTALDSTVDRTSDSGKSLKFTSKLTGGLTIWKFKTLFASSFTEADLGRKFKVSAWVKPEDDSNVYFGLTSLNNGASAGFTRWNNTLYSDDLNTITTASLTAGEWQKISVMVTVTEPMLGSYYTGYETSGYNPEVIGLRLPLGSAMYVDDVSVVEYVDGVYSQAVPTDAVTVSSSAVSDSDLGVTKSAGAAEEGIKKAYLHFEAGEYTDTQKATLNINVTQAIGQTLKVYGLIDSAYPASLTYDTAPGTNTDETMDEGKLYGGAALDEITVTDSGIYSFDVTNYVKENSPNEYIFVITSEDAGGYEYYRADFSSMPVTDGIDYIADSTVTVSDGVMNVSGNKITFLNVFGNDGKAADAGEFYQISADVTALVAGDVVIGFAKADGTITESAAYSLAEGVNTNISLGYTVTEADEEICAVTIESANAGFIVDNVTVDKGDAAVVISKNAELIAEVAEQVASGEKATVNISTVGGKGVTVNGYDKGESVIEEAYVGTTVELGATGDGKFMYWIDANSNTILSYSELYSYTVGTDRSIAAVYADDTDVFVTFTSMANKLLGAGIASAIKVPSDPYVYGYKFNGWYANGEKTALTEGGAVDAIASTEYIAGFVLESVAYKVTVDGNVSEYAYNEKVTAVADAEKDAKAFSYWKRDGEIVSYSAEYSFYVNGDTTVESVYGEDVSEKSVLAMANPVLVDGSKIAFFAERDIPKGYTLIESGILIGTSAGLTVDSADVKVAAKSVENNGQFTVRKKNLTDSVTYYGVAYAIYRDASGNLVTDYSNEVSYTYKITE